MKKNIILGIALTLFGCTRTAIRYKLPDIEKMEFEYELPRLKMKLPTFLIYQGIYLNSIAATRLDRYLKRIKNTEINCIVVDFKDAHGFVTYDTNVEFAKTIGAKIARLDIEEIVKKCEAHGIYLIGRIVVFKDSILANYNDGEFAIKNKEGKMWRDKHGSYWVNQYSREVWRYNIEIAKDIANRGVKEVQFDYIRFPSRGDFESVDIGDVYDKEEAIAGFLKEARKVLSPIGVNVAGDLYGYTIWFPRLEREGQNLKKLAEYLDIVCPMLYPSHFHDDFMARKNPREYHIVYESLVRGDSLLGENKLVAYIQGFNLRSPNFGPEYIENQIKAVRDAHVLGYIVWNARSNYRLLWELLDK
ncbi:MAG TPA: hypothetical protein EYP60_04250 [bacterium (Candidatus Stahlbacteria)]|nr:hypothetical protein [Candidatus Stahlbacteria bacterium]